MQSGNYAYQSDFARKYVAEGKAEGKAEGRADAVLAIFAARDISVSSTQRDRIAACQDLPTLDRWIAGALSASSPDELVPEPVQK